MSERDLKQESTNKELIRAAFADWVAGTGGPFTLLADDASWTIVGNAPVGLHGAHHIWCARWRTRVRGGSRP